MSTQEIIPAGPSIGQMVVDDYRKAEIFKRFGIDFCCGGKAMLEETCAKKAIDVAAVKQALKDLDVKHPSHTSHEYNSWELDFLSEYIVKTHHNYINQTLPLLEEFSTKVARVHGELHPEVIEIASLFQAIAIELTAHMNKEETILFPYIKQMVMTEQNEKFLFSSPFGTVQNPIHMMELEHDSAGGSMETIRALSNQYNPPEGACNTYRVLYAKLQEFENDLHQHIHLENNILFPKAIKLEAELLSS